MASYTKNTDRMDIYIEESRGTILIRQKWRYFWLNAPGTSNWTYDEKRGFHRKVDNLIWNSWGAHFFLKVEGASDFAKKHTTTCWDINFDIEWVLNAEHWKVNVEKIAKGSYARSKVDWNGREIEIDSEDTQKYKRDKSGTSYYQYPVVHEFGHAIGNSYVFNRGDEYKSSSSHFNDRNSIMNVGDKLRDRHLWYIIDELNTMIPDSTFSKY